jgi:carboxylesterase type B
MSIRRVTVLLSLVLAACVPLAIRAQQPACTTGIVQTSSGPVCGKSSPINIPGPGAFTANAYLGIPYAQPPVGTMRWQNPVAPNAWTAPFQATQFGNACLQPPPPPAKPSCPLAANQSEDCLYLNVWTPTGAAPSAKLPVLMFIHGGAFYEGTGGSSTADTFDGTYLAASQNVVVVTFNYRLGVLGFLATHDMPAGSTGNFGFRDQLMALNWVHQNIASFGGNASQVLIFGQSAGAMSVGLHALSSPQSAGLFKAALMESNPLGVPYKTLAQAKTFGTAYSKLLNCSNLQCLQQKSACELVVQENSPCLPANAFAPTATLLSSALHWAPTIDGSLITGQPMDNVGSNLKVPMLMGTNQDEGFLFASLMASAPTCPTNPKVPNLSPQARYAISLGVLFGVKQALAITANSRYSCPQGSPTCTPQLANVITDYLFTCANRQFAGSAGSAPLYMYLFNHAASFNTVPALPTCLGQICHGAELAFVFNTAELIPSTTATLNAFQPAEEALSQTMGGYWASFAKSQSPGTAWPLFNPNKTYLKLDVSSSTANDPLSTTANCNFWATIAPYQNNALWDRLLAPVKAAPKKKPAH